MPVTLDWSFEDPEDEDADQSRYRLLLVDVGEGSSCLDQQDDSPIFSELCLDAVNVSGNGQYVVSANTSREVMLAPGRRYAWTVRAETDSSILGVNELGEEYARRSDLEVTGFEFFETVSEIGDPPECSDGWDNDDDELIDEDDPGCKDTDDSDGDGDTEEYDPGDDNESGGGGTTPECRDGWDNDDDGHIDEDDPGCQDEDGNYDEDDDDESDDGTGDQPECSNDEDDDDDDLIDFGDDPGCASPADDDEDDDITDTECSNGKDDDGDHHIDADDPDCRDEDGDYHPEYEDEEGEDDECGNLEQACCDLGGLNSCDVGQCNLNEDDEIDGYYQTCRPECSDGVNNDDDELIDKDDPGCQDTDDSDGDGDTEEYDPGDNLERDSVQTFTFRHNPQDERVIPHPHFPKDIYITSSYNQTMLTVTPHNGFSDPVTIKVLGFREDNIKNSTECPEIITEIMCADGVGEGNMRDRDDEDFSDDTLFYYFKDKDNATHYDRHVTVNPGDSVKFYVSKVETNFSEGRYIIYLQATGGGITKTNEVLLVIGANTPGFRER